MNIEEILNHFYSYTGKILQEQDRIRLGELVNKISMEINYIVIDEFDDKWDIKKKSKLIESFIINCPVPPIIIYETSYNKHKVIDGKQRLKTILDYYNNRFSLNGLEFATKLNSLTYNDLPANFRGMLDRRNLQVISIVFDNNLTPEEIAKLLNNITERYK